MPQAKSTKTIHQKLAKIQKDLKAPKGQYNTFSKFSYRSCEDILEALKPLLGNFCLTLTDDLVQVGDRYYIKATVKISDGAESIENTAFAREALEKKGMGASQITGAASSYARKYALNGLFAIDDTKDADVPVASPAEPAQAATQAPTQAAKKSFDPGSNIASEKQRKYIFALGKDLGHEPEKLKEMIKIGFKVSSFTYLTKDQASQCIDRMQKKVAEQVQAAAPVPAPAPAPAPASEKPAHEEFTGEVGGEPDGSEDVDPNTMPF